MKFKILAIEHVAIAFNELEAPSEFFGKILGINNTSTEIVKDQGVTTDIFDTGAGKIELLESIHEDSSITRFLSKRGNSVHHIAFRVDNLQLAIDELSDKNIEFVDQVPRIGAEGMLIAFLHPKSTSGILIELCQKP